MNKIWEAEVEIKIEKNNDIEDAAILKLDSSKAKNILGWESDTSMDEILLTIYKWENNLNQIELNSKKLIQDFFK